MPYVLYIVLGYTFYALAIGTHLLVLTKKISFKNVNGGRSESFEAQSKTSITSMVVLGMGWIILMFFHIFPGLSTTVFGMILMGILSLYWLLGFIMQLMGTPFERRYVSLVLVLGVFSHVMLFLTYFLQ